MGYRKERLVESIRNSITLMGENRNRMTKEERIKALFELTYPELTKDWSNLFNLLSVNSPIFGLRSNKVSERYYSMWLKRVFLMSLKGGSFSLETIQDLLKPKEFVSGHNPKVTGSSKMGDLDGVSYQELVHTFGKPTERSSGDGKTNAEWIITLEDGTVVTIYDYKSDVAPEDNLYWSVGAHIMPPVYDIYLILGLL